jgi:hypothetical protein
MSFTKGQVYCVKVNQHLIRKDKKKVHYFPFDRSYLVHRDDEHLMKRAFRYYMVMDLTPQLQEMLNLLHVENEKYITIYRNDELFRGKRPCTKKRFPELPEEEWVLVVPTHVIPKSRKRRKTPDHSAIGYLVSSVIGENQNAEVELPPIAVQTPSHRIPLLCSVCTKLPSYYDGKCQPGTAQCRKGATTRIALDKSRQEDAAKSIEESGDMECP